MIRHIRSVKFMIKKENFSVKTIVNLLVNGLYTLILRYSILIPHLLLLGVMLLLVLATPGMANGVLIGNSFTT